MTFVNIFKDFYSESDSYDNHYDNDRKYTNNLIEQSEKSNPLEDTSQKRTVHSDWNEAVCAWKNTVPFPRYVATPAVSNVIKRQSRDTHKAEEIDNNASVKCIGEDFDTFPVPWKANVEQGTYRYVTNNAYYRTVKILDYRDRREWYTIHKKHPEIVSMHWQNKRFNKELKRNLRRDLEIKFHHHNRRQQSIVMENAPESSRKAVKEEGDRNTESTNSARNVQLAVPQSSRECKSEHKIESEHNSDSLNKASSDMNIDKISTRITALNEELKRDSRLRKSHEIADLSKFFLQTKEFSSKSKKKDGKSTEEIMTVRSVAQRGELKPVEKVTPAQKIIAAESKKSKSSQLRYTNSTGNDAAAMSVPSIPDSFHIASPDLEKALNSYKLAIETTKQSLFNTLTGNKNQRRTVSGGGKVAHSAPPSMCENTPEGGRLLDQPTPDGVHSVSSLSGKDKTLDKKPQFSGLLPGISGKRLEVGPSANRWM